ncbi:MAG: formate/nitrite transporter family protein [Gemmatimonadota bacterium]|jgi:formate/nitrite transporter
MTSPNVDPLPHGHLVEAYAPAQIAHKVLDVGVSKANLPASSTIALAVLAGAFIAMGAAFSTITTTGSTIGFGLTRVVGGVSFCLGLILVVIAGAELFTGNNLVAMAWATRAISTRHLVRNWLIVYVGNLVGAIGTALLVLWTGTWRLADFAVGQNALRIALMKCEIGWTDAFFRGVMCNALVCLAVWLAHAGRSTTDRTLAVLWPITAFVALGFEHCVANMYFIPLGILLKSNPDLTAGIQGLDALGMAGFMRNLVPVTLGNIVGGTLLVAGIYWFVYLRPARPRARAS